MRAAGVPSQSRFPAGELTESPASVLVFAPMIRNEQPGFVPDRRTAALLRSLLLLAA